MAELTLPHTLLNFDVTLVMYNATSFSFNTNRIFLKDFYEHVIGICYIVKNIEEKIPRFLSSHYNDNERKCI